MQCGDQVPFRLGGVSECRGGLPGTSLEAPRLALLPATETGPFVDEQSPQELTPIEPQSRFELAAVEALLELDGVAGETSRIDTEELVTLRGQHVVSDVTADGVERLAQRVARPLLALFGPEHDEQTVAPVQAARPCSREVGEDCQPLGLQV